MKLPKLITRKRTKGFKLPPNTLCITRPGRWGNPFETAGEFGLGMAIVTGYNFPYPLFFSSRSDERKMIWIHEHILELCQYDYIACWRKDHSKCHGTILLKYLEAKLKNK